ncbi:hypothetical protein [Nocardia seriolae]|uniref:Uncharacterized protein n=1 Tax=Nocardia seriolae TaxID=37332 RepID=A0ABC9YUC3_9NOCA|nr:hypothetical protein [Nocardia seriolae]APA99886.1 hypothetical protein NS506_05850 [Nocardia seriolae]QOW36381.1 hypothetical protein IMZ23_16865 [Nocardia seriolae]QUN16104.1 hypothetical protein KEC46_28040 [Nocardia seriolae]WKY54958.1 hypothetical protein Q5P07_13530 [Nocardia seriolae]WNJ56847.1 hypothetical protein RMO66_25730 [Nocardia seriolae]
MGVIGELFPGKKLEDDGSEAGDGQQHRPRLAVDLDAGVIKLSPPAADADPESPAAQG